jgi:hypothetical protein
MELVSYLTQVATLKKNFATAHLRQIMSLRAAVPGFPWHRPPPFVPRARRCETAGQVWRRGNLLLPEICQEMGGCFVGKSKTPPRNDICKVEKKK